MFIRHNFDVLVVDDEPDILSITKIALRNVKVFGASLKVKTCQSKAEAIEVLNADAKFPLIGMVLVDVVMESDNAGLELCDYIRNTLKNKVTQIIVRTGQPGKAPERDVIDRYDICGYVTKVDATEERIYSVVKGALGTFFWSRYATGLFNFSTTLIPRAKSIQTLLDTIEEYTRTVIIGSPSVEAHMAYTINGRDFVGIGNFKDKALVSSTRDKLRRTDRVERLNAHGDTLIYADGDVVMNLVARNSDEMRLPSIEVVSKVNFEPPPFVVSMFHQYLQAVQNLAALAMK
jgi:CheY-like chemotaxis protein